ncbi:MAG: DNA-directed RNA polymerase subunit L [Candidatus Aramenus sp.]|nr:DNA-directed RNA polymerase subunit L [Candidatus Aramenus sp.]
MEIRVIKSSNTYMEIEIKGEDHTLGNLVAGYLRRVRGVTFASYYQPHPLVDSIILKVMTDGSIEPKEAIINAIEKAKETSAKFDQEIRTV